MNAEKFDDMLFRVDDMLFLFPMLNLTKLVLI